MKIDKNFIKNMKKSLKNLKRPGTPTWSDQQYYEQVLKCENIYWYSETNKSSQYKCWHYVGEDITIWQ